MKKTFFTTILSLTLLAGASVLSRASTLDDLAGRWTISKTNAEGNAFKQVIEFKKDKFVFRIIGAEDKTVIYAEGKVKLEKVGDLEIIKFTDVQYGKSKDELQAADDDRSDVFTLREGRFILASNFDKERDGQKPEVDAYEKVVEKAADAK